VSLDFLIEKSFNALFRRKSMPYVKVGDINMYYEIHGEGEPLVLVCGFGGDITRWARILPTMSRDYRVIIYDNRGAGKTDKPDTPYTMDMMADDLAGLLDAIGIDSAHILGISMGGMIAQNFALRHPGKVKALILGCTSCSDPGEDPDNAGKDIVDPVRLETMTVEERARSSLPFIYSQEFIDNNPDIIEEEIAMSVNNPVDVVGYNRQADAITTNDTYNRLPQLKMPVLVIAGDEDRLLPVKHSRIIASRVPGAQLTLLKGKGHGFFSEALDESKRIIDDFIKRSSA
jgi:pimeloyl-ACP methyl ester carboxylesterase